MAYRYRISDIVLGTCAGSASATVLLTIALLACAKRLSSENDGQDDRHEHLVELCALNCLRPLCAGNILVDAEYEAACESRCETRVTESEAIDCADEYENLLTCLEQASCEDFYLWYEQVEGAPCLDLEAEFVGLCPWIELRD